MVPFEVGSETGPNLNVTRPGGEGQELSLPDTAGVFGYLWGGW